MNTFPKKSTKRLNLQEMWQVYSSLRSGLTKNSEKYLLHEILKMMDRISTDDFRNALQVMGIPESKDPLKVTIAFVKSLKRNEFFSFAQFIKSIHGK